MRHFLLSLFSADETVADSTTTCGIAALLVFFGLTISVVARDSSVWTPVAWAAYAGSIGTIIAIVSGARTARARWSSGMQSATVVTSPDEVTQTHVESKP